MTFETAGMAELIETFDWERNVLGPHGSWAMELRLMVGVALKTRFPMLVFWGPDLVQIYNDAFVPILGARHPAALGQFARDCWPEIWDTVGPLLHGAYESAEPAWGENTPLVLERNGFPEQTYFTFCYSQFGTVNAGGVLCTCVETTRSVSRELEFRAMADNIANILYTHAPDGTVEWANSRWYEYSQLPAEIATTSEGWALVLPPEDHALLMETLARAFANGETYDAEVRIKPYGATDDAFRWHILRAVPMRAADGRIIRWAGSATDVHDRKAAQMALRERLERDLDREHRASVAFQNAALPQHLPMAPGVRFDAMYEAAGHEALVGGDWYDAFRLPDGRLVISVGDVVGNGLRAAVTMAAARQAIRGAVHVFPEPAAVLDAADRALRSEQPDRIVTAFLGIFDPLTRFLSYAFAGHPPPMLRHPDGTVTELVGNGLPLGLRNESGPGENFVTTLPENALLVLYTDGLTESTHDLFEGEHRLRETLARDDIFEAVAPAGAIRRAVLTKATDDVAILTLRTCPVSERITRWSSYRSDASNAMNVRREFAAVLRADDIADDDIADAELVFGELLGNVVRHTDGHVEVTLDLSANDPVLHVLDRGPGFTFHARLPNDSLSETGRGLYIAAQLAREVSVVRRTGGGSHARVVLAARRNRKRHRIVVPATA